MPVAETFGVRKVWIERLSTDLHSGRVELAGVEVKRRRNTVLLAGLEDAQLVEPLRIRAPRGEGWNPLSGQRVRLEGRELVVGTWALGEKGKDAQAFFVAPVVSGVVGTSVRTSFTELKHLFDHLPARKEARKEARAARTTAAGSEMNISQSLFVHDIYAQDGQLILSWRRLGAGVPHGEHHPNHDNQWRELHHHDHQASLGGQSVHPRRPDEEKRAVLETAEGDRVQRGQDSQAELWYDDQLLLRGVQRVVGDDGRQTVFVVSKIGPAAAAASPSGG